MYRKQAGKWVKHWDFMLSDAICIVASYVIVYYIMRYQRGTSLAHFFDNMYQNEAILLLLTDLAVAFFTEPYKNILRRSKMEELWKTIQHVATVFVANIICLYFLHQAQPYSRLLIGWSMILAIALCYIARRFLKGFIKKRASRMKAERAIVIVTTSDRMDWSISNIIDKTYHAYEIPAVFLLDRDVPENTKRGDIPVFGKSQDIIDYICHQWCDAVYINVDQGFYIPESITDSLLGMGITIHSAIDFSGGEHVVERLGEDYVVTSSMKMVSTRMMVTKRFLDILGGIIGCIVTGIIFIIIAPQIYHASPGPIFFSQIRIGRNGKKFRMYKFRSMYMDAEERKKELLAQNKSKDGMIFKMDDDPRIIGSEKKDKNGRPNGIGNKIRRTSLDEFPQFWNVLRGDMSLVGTRPPTVDEWEKYSAEQRLRMSIKPGITGLWQVSGRSDITDFNEIVKLDTEYIQNMSIGEDFKILLKTVKVVLKHVGAE